MYNRLCLLCLILSCRFVIGRLPVDESPVNTLDEYDGLISEQFPGVYGIIYVHSSFYVLYKNKVASIRITTENGGQTTYKIDEVINWVAPEATNVNCKRKNSDSSLCNNFIRIFAPKDAAGREFIVCGTHSMDPKCRIYSKQNNAFKKDARSSDFSGTSICPYDPTQTGVSLFTGGDLYAATFEDLLGRKPVIYRHAVASSHENLEKETSAWLRDPWYVKFVEADPKVYILFKETAVEDSTGATYSRIGQMCQNDAGGVRILRKQFTSYAKARLNCSYPGDPPFYFNEIGAASDFYEMPGQSSKQILFAAMNTPKNSIWGSAVCAYLEEDIEQTMSGPYMEKNAVEGVSGVSYWSEKESDSAVTESLRSCPYDNREKSDMSVENLQFIRDHPLKARSVPSWSKDGSKRTPIFMKIHAEYQFSAITIDPAAGTTTQYLTMILGTTNGKILKVIPPLTNSIKESHFISETSVYDEKICGSDGDRQVRDIKIDKDSGYILAAFSSCIVSVPMCPFDTSTCERECIAARDPYCAWDGEKCSTVLRSNSWTQDVLEGNVDDLAPCVVLPPDDDGTNPVNGVGGKGGNALNNSVTILNATTPDPAAGVSSKNNQISSAGFDFNWISVVVGVLIGLFIAGIILMWYCCRKRQRSSGSYKAPDEKYTRKESNNSSEGKRNSYGQKPDRPLSNHTQRIHSKRSESSAEDELFLDNNSEGNSNSIEKKNRRKRELSSNRKSNTSSYRRDDSVERVSSNHLVNRQTSRESNESGYNFEIDATQPPSPPNPSMHRTMSSAGAPRPHNNRELKRQLSLQMPSNHPMMNYQQTLTPMGFMSSPFEQLPQGYAPAPGQMPPQHFDPSGAPWHQSPAKNPKAMPSQHQTTSLDRKMVRAGGYVRNPHGVPHDVPPQQQGRNYADTLPSHVIDDPRAQGRKRYPSESGIVNHRPAVAKAPIYQSIEEETSPLPESAQTTFAPGMQARTTGRIRPSNLPVNEGFPRFAQPNPNTITLTDKMQSPQIMVSPTQQKPLPGNHVIRRNNSEIPTSNAIPPHRDMPHPHSVPALLNVTSKSNPTTPDVDPNHNSFFRDQVDPANMRKRHPSGKSITPTSKEFPGRPDLIPSTPQAAETAHLETNRSEPPSV